MLTYGRSMAMSRSSAVSFTVSAIGVSFDIAANMRFSATLNTGCPHGESSYASGKESASPRIWSAMRCGFTPLDRVCLDAVAEAKGVGVLALPFGLALGGAALPALVEEDHHPDRELEEDHQRNHLERRRHRVDPRQRDGDGRDDHVAEAAVPPEAVGRQDPDPRHGQHEDRQLEDDRAGDENEHDERVVALRLDLDVELRAVVARQEVNGGLRDD